MKMKKKSVLLATLSLSAAACLVGATINTVNVNADTAQEPTPYAFANTKIAGAQLRLDDDGMRFVLEMSKTDYDEYKKTDGAFTYEAGVLIIPTNKVDDVSTPEVEQLTVDTDYVATVPFNTTYVPKKVTDGQTQSYRFNAVLTDVPQYARSISARGYVKATPVAGGEAQYVYTDTVERTISYVASDYFDDYEVTSREYQKVTNYVLTAYNTKYGESITDISEIDLGVFMNEANAVMVNNVAVDGYSNAIQVKDGIEKLLLLSYETKDTAGQLSTNELSSSNTRIKIEDGKVVAQKRGTAAVLTSACNGLVQNRYDVKVLDEDILQVGYGYNRSTGAWTNNYYPAYNQHAQWFVDAQVFHTANGYFNGRVNNLSTDVHGYGMDGESPTVSFTYSATTGGAADSVYIQANLQYTKAQIKMLLDSGYDRLVCPVKVDVPEQYLKSESFNYDESTDRYRNYMDLIMPNANITGKNVFMSEVTTSFSQGVTQGTIVIGEWMNVEISLQVIYDNYTQFTKMSASGTDSYANRSWPLFGLANSGNSLDTFITPNFERTVSIKDFYVAKSEGMKTATVNGEQRYLIDLTNPTAKDSFNYANQSNKALSMNVTVKNGAVELINTAQTGSYYAWKNGMAPAANGAIVGAYGYTSLHSDFGLTVAQLTALQDAGYTTLKYEATAEILFGDSLAGENGLETLQGCYADDGTTVTRRLKTFYYNGSGGTITCSIPIQALIDNISVSGAGFTIFNCQFDRDKMVKLTLSNIGFVKGA